MKMGSEKFCLRWNDFESNISVAFRELRDDKDFFDVTLACDDEQIQAHKVILSACSPFFRQILRRNVHQHPLLYLKGVKYTDIQSVLNFMYHGEVNVAQEDLNSFLAVAEELRVKGLTQGPNTNSSTSKSDSRPAPPSRPRSPPAQHSSTPVQKRARIPTNDDDIQEVAQVPVKSEPVDHISAQQTVQQPKYYNTQPSKVSAPHQSSYSDAATNQQTGTFPPATTELASYTTEVYDDQQDESYDDYGQYVDEYNAQGMDPAGGAGHKGYGQHQSEEFSFSCETCGKFYKNKASLATHVSLSHGKNESSGQAFPCTICGKSYNTKNALNTHKSRYHKSEKEQYFNFVL